MIASPSPPVDDVVDVLVVGAGPAGASAARTLSGRDGREFRAPLVVAADGVRSVVARRLGLNRGWPASAVALDMMEETARTELRDVDPSMPWVQYGDRGYSYVFPKRDHVNIGIGYVLSHFRESIDAAP